jgi:ankyrin repeat protein
MADDAYGDDDFEAEVELDTSKKSGGGLSLLKSAAQKVDKEEKEHAASVLKESAEDMKGIAKLLGDADRKHDEEDRNASHLRGEDSEEEEDEDVSLNGDNDDDPELNSALRVACNKGNLTKVRSLVDKGANIKARDRHGWTALHWGAKAGNADVMDFLLKEVGSLDSHAYVNCKDVISGWTPLMLACMSGKEEAVRSLISHGAKANKKNHLGEAACDFVPAVSKHRRSIMKLLGVKEEEEESKDGAGGDESKRSDAK